MALLAGAPEKLPEQGKKSALKSKEDKPSTSVSAEIFVFLPLPSALNLVKKNYNRVQNQSETYMNLQCYVINMEFILKRVERGIETSG